MKTILRGSCLCGAVAFEFEGDIDHFVCCHCTRCRKASGTVHGANLFSSRGTLRWSSGLEHVRDFELAGTRYRRAFCDTCGSALPSARPADTIVVPAGCLDTVLDRAPDMHIHCSSRARWEDSLDETARFPELPDGS